MDTATIRDRIENYYSALSAMDPSRWTPLFSATGEICDPVGTPCKLVSEASGPFFELLQRFYDQLDVQTQSLFVAGESAAAQWQMTVIAKNGRTGIATGISTFEFNESGLLQKVASYWDETALMKQLK